jgi:hypothetical protein
MLIINRMKRNSYYDIDKIFLRGLTVRDIAEPLPSFDFQTTAESVLSAMKLHHFQIAGVVRTDLSQAMSRAQIWVLVHVVNTAIQLKNPRYCQVMPHYLSWYSLTIRFFP